MKAFGSAQLAQPYWESSQRLLHPKCVWVKSFGGYRHFIFDRSMSRDQTKNEASSQYEIETGSTTAKCTEMSGRNQEIGNERSKSLEFSQNDSLKIIGSADSKLSAAKEMRSNNLHSKHERILEPGQQLNKNTSSEVELDSIRSSNTNIQQLSNEIDLCKDLLADRVLQWLDLAENNRTVCINRMESIERPTAKRRSVTAKEPTEAMEGQPGVRRESIHHLSMTFDENTANVIQTDDIIRMEQGDIALRFDQFFPTTYRCFRKLLSLRRTTVPAKPFHFINKSNHNATMIEASPHERRPIGVASRKEKQSGKFGVAKSKRFTEYVDDQYHSMIQRQILETSCNKQLTKRQLHIFMPNLPKKCSNDDQPYSGSPNDGASCIISHAPSK